MGKSLNKLQAKINEDILGSHFKAALTGFNRDCIMQSLCAGRALDILSIRKEYKDQQIYSSL